ncbi:MAG TPA: MFS transporter [Dermatophilaceae bacterium]|nr:MFS transporter [Dermatophilaceae bacterium]
MTSPTGSAKAGGVHLPEALAPLRDRRFTWFLAGRSISSAGSVMAPIALSFAVLEMDESASTLGQVLAARSVALVGFLLVGGVIADRFSRSTVLLISHLASALTQGAVAVLVLTGRVEFWQIITLEVANGALNAFTMPAIQGLVPQVVPRAHLQQANALMSFSRGGMTVLGPAAAGLLVVTVGPGWGLAVDAVSWLLAAACMIPVGLPTPSRDAGTHHSLLRELSSGWSVFVSRTWLWTVVLAFGILNAIHAGAWLTLGPLLSLQEPAIGETGWGYALSAQAVGLLVMTLVMLRLTFRYPLRAGLLAMIPLAAPLIVIAGKPDLRLLILACLVGGAGVEIFVITWQTAIHENVPDDHMSRVWAYDSLGSFAAIPIGQTIYGPLAIAFGARPVVLASAGLFLLVVLLTLAVPEVRNLQRGPCDQGVHARAALTGPAAAGRARPTRDEVSRGPGGPSAAIDLRLTSTQRPGSAARPRAGDAARSDRNL